MRSLLFTALLSLFLQEKLHAQSTEHLEIARFNHLALQVKNLEASAKFYRETLGLTPIEVPDTLKAIRAWFQLGDGQQLHLLAGRKKATNNDRNGSHFALFVKSINETEAFLEKKGIKKHVQIRFDGTKQIYISDPDGYLIEFNQQK